MNTSRWLLATFALALAAAAPASAQDVVAYPAKGQGAEQQAKDAGECRAWASKNTGFDPNTPPPAYYAPQEKKYGAAKGALGGAVIGGAIGGSDAAWAGAAVGGVFGGVRQSNKNQQAEAQSRANYDQAMAHYQQRRGEYNRAASACLETRGYTVR